MPYFRAETPRFDMKKRPKRGVFTRKLYYNIEYQRIMRKCAKISGKSEVLFDWHRDTLYNMYKISDGYNLLWPNKRLTRWPKIAQRYP